MRKKHPTGLLVALCASAVAFQQPVPKLAKSSQANHHGPAHVDLVAEDKHTHDHSHKAVLATHTHDGSTHVHDHLHDAAVGVHTHDGSTHVHASDEHLHEAVLGKHTHDGSTHTHAADLHIHDHLHEGATGKHTHGGSTHVHAADSHAHVAQDCTVAFDAEGSYCLEDRDSRSPAPMTLADALTCLATDECEVPERYASLLEIKPTKPSLQVFDSEGSHVRAR